MSSLADVMLLCVVGAVLLRGAAKGVPVYDAFLAGAGEGMRSGIALFPSLCGMMLMLSLMASSGLSTLLVRALSPLLSLAGLPREVAPMLILRPLTGSGSLAALEEMISTCGVDSRAGRIAAVLMGSSETIFYTMTVYLAAVKPAPRLSGLMPISMMAYLAGAIVCGLLL